MNISTIKTASKSLRGDALTIGALRDLIRECDAAHVPDSATVTFKQFSGGYSASAVWTALPIQEVA